MTVATVSPNLTRPRLLMLLDDPVDSRIEREATSLTQAGYAVHILSSHFWKPTDPLRETLPFAELSRACLPQTPGQWPAFWMFPPSRLLSRGVLRNVCKRLTQVDPPWLTAAIQAIDALRPQLLHVHDLKLVPLGVLLSERYGLPLVADIHENYPALVESYRQLYGKDGRSARRLWERVEREILPKATHILPVSLEMWDHFQRLGIPAAQMTLVPNTVNLQKFEHPTIQPVLPPEALNKFVFGYVGLIDAPHRGIHLLLEAFGQNRAAMPNAFLLLAGIVNDQYRPQLDAIIERYDLQAHVHFTGWINESEFPSHIAACQVCVAPSTRNEAIFGIHTKLYVYHLFQKPILASSVGPNARYIQESQGGVVFEAEDVADLGRHMVAMYQDPQGCQHWGEQGQRAVRERFNWSVTERDLIHAYRQLLPLPPSTMQPPALVAQAEHSL
ncbi:MAG: glycosyltransferase family 4 protein [Candidatus Melainabacteria bacterium]|nr:glycosyltransferase family 4 protein [Candidatus Melainabacteria bacterium]